MSPKDFLRDHAIFLSVLSLVLVGSAFSLSASGYFAGTETRQLAMFGTGSNGGHMGNPVGGGSGSYNGGGKMGSGSTQSGGASKTSGNTSGVGTGGGPRDSNNAGAQTGGGNTNTGGNTGNDTGRDGGTRDSVGGNAGNNGGNTNTGNNTQSSNDRKESEAKAAAQKAQDARTNYSSTLSQAANKAAADAAKAATVKSITDTVTGYTKAAVDGIKSYFSAENPRPKSLGEAVANLAKDDGSYFGDLNNTRVSTDPDASRRAEDQADKQRAEDAQAEAIEQRARETVLREDGQYRDPETGATVANLNKDPESATTPQTPRNYGDLNGPTSQPRSEEDVAEEIENRVKQRVLDDVGQYYDPTRNVPEQRKTGTDFNPDATVRRAPPLDDVRTIVGLRPVDDIEIRNLPAPPAQPTTPKNVMTVSVMTEQEFRKAYPNAKVPEINQHFRTNAQTVNTADKKDSETPQTVNTAGKTDSETPQTSDVTSAPQSSTPTAKQAENYTKTVEAAQKAAETKAVADAAAKAKADAAAKSSAPTQEVVDSYTRGQETMQKAAEAKAKAEAADKAQADADAKAKQEPGARVAETKPASKPATQQPSAEKQSEPDVEGGESRDNLFGGISDPFNTDEKEEKLAKMRRDEEKVIEQAEKFRELLDGQISLEDAIVSVTEIVKTAAGEAGQEHRKEDKVAVINTIINRIALGAATKEVVEVHRVLDAFDANMQRDGTLDNPNYATADIGTPGYDSASEALDDVLDGNLPSDMPEAVKNASNYYTGAQPYWAKGATKTKYGPHTFLNDKSTGMTAGRIVDAKAAVAQGASTAEVKYGGTSAQIQKDVERAKAVAAKVPPKPAPKAKPQDQLADNPDAELKQKPSPATIKEKPVPKGEDTPPSDAKQPSEVPEPDVKVEPASAPPGGSTAPSGEGAVTAPGSVIAEAPVVSELKGKIRSLPASEELVSDVRQAVARVYGPGYTVQIVSAGQKPRPVDPKTGKLKDCRGGGCSGRTNSNTTRHDIDPKTKKSSAVDVNVTGPDGEKLSGPQLAPLAQDWQARNLGSTGYYGDSMLHLDHVGGVKGRPLRGAEQPSWDWTEDGSATFADAVAKGRKGIKPAYKGVDGSKAKFTVGKTDITGRKTTDVPGMGEDEQLAESNPPVVEKKEKVESKVAETKTKVVEKAKAIASGLKTKLDAAAKKLGDDLGVEEAQKVLEEAYTAIVEGSAVPSVSFEQYDPKKASTYTYDFTVPASAIDTKFIDSFVKDPEVAKDLKEQLARATMLPGFMQPNVRIGMTVEPSVMTTPAEPAPPQPTTPQVPAETPATVPEQKVHEISDETGPLADVTKEEDGTLRLTDTQPVTKNPDGPKPVTIDGEEYDIEYEDGKAISIGPRIADGDEPAAETQPEQEKTETETETEQTPEVESETPVKRDGVVTTVVRKVLSWLGLGNGNDSAKEWEKLGTSSPSVNY